MLRRMKHAITIVLSDKDALALLCACWNVGVLLAFSALAAWSALT